MNFVFLLYMAERKEKANIRHFRHKITFIQEQFFKQNA